MVEFLKVLRSIQVIENDNRQDKYKYSLTGERIGYSSDAPIASTVDD